ncbi:MAG: class E sortase [Acidimicrobiia bacterium]
MQDENRSKRAGSALQMGAALVASLALFTACAGPKISGPTSGLPGANSLAPGLPTSTSLNPDIEQTVPVVIEGDTPVIGHMRIPALELDTDIYEGIELRNIAHGPSHWPGTAMPGENGNFVLAGHRVTQTKPFRNLDQLKPGDEAIVTTPQGRFTYRLTGTAIVSPEQTEIVEDKPGQATATMFACHPPGSAVERIVAYWRLDGTARPRA